MTSGFIFLNKLRFMLEFIDFTIKGIILIVISIILIDIFSFISESYKYYKNMEIGDIYIYFELPTRKYKVKIVEKKCGKILYQYIYKDGSLGPLNYSWFPIFFISSDISK